MIIVRLTVADIEGEGACEKGLALFARVAPSGVWAGEWTMLHALWLARDVPHYSKWLIAMGFVPAICYVGANLRGANLRHAYLVDACLDGADLRDARLERAHLEGARLGGADLRGADLSGADLDGADLRDADLRCARLEGTDLRRANLEGMRVKSEDLWYARRWRTRGTARTS